MGSKVFEYQGEEIGNISPAQVRLLTKEDLYGKVISALEEMEGYATTSEIREAVNEKRRYSAKMTPQVLDAFANFGWTERKLEEGEMKWDTEREGSTWEESRRILDDSQDHLEMIRDNHEAGQGY